MTNASYRSYDHCVKTAILVVYNHIPNFETLNVICDNVQNLLIVDNNSNECILTEIKSYVESHKNASLIESKLNLGISKAYNLAFEKCTKLHSDIIIFFDHDIILDDTLFQEYRKAWDYLFRIDKNLGIIVPIVTDDTNLIGKSMFNQNHYNKILSPINSGILTTVEVFNLVGGYDPDLFVEFADYYYAYKVRKAGRNIYRINKVLILQEFEVKLQQKNLLTTLADELIRLRSIVRLGLNNSNIFRTTLSVYNPRRNEELHRALHNLKEKHPDTKRFLIIVNLLNKIEEFAINIIKKLSN